MQPYETLFLVASVAVIILFICYIAYCYWSNKKEEAQPAILANTPEETAIHNNTGKEAELAFLKEQIQLIQQRIEAIERGY